MYQPTVNPAPLMTRELLSRGTFAAQPLVVVDGGARGGPEGHWRHYGDAMRIIALEPDPAECRRLTAELAPGESLSYVPVALGRRRARRTLHLAAYPDSSSLLAPDPDFVGRFGVARWYDTAGESEVEVTDLDSLVADQGLPGIDFLKLDVEGAELEVLEGGQAILSDVMGVSVEVWFQRERAERPLFAEIDSHLRERGLVLFDLRELNRWLRATRAGPQPGASVGQGQLVYGQALYLRDLPGAAAADRSPRGALALASFAEVFCYPDFAAEVLLHASREGVLEAAQAEALVSLLAGQAAAPSGRSQRLARGAYRALVPPALRRRLTQRVTALLNE